MKVVRGVHVDNIFWMLAYAWDEVPAAKSVSSSLDVTGAPLTPFAACFLSGVERLTRQGFAQAYRHKRGHLRTIRGRVDAVSTMLDPLRRPWCEYDQLSSDTLPNRLIRTALRRIDQEQDLAHGLRERARKLDRRFEHIRLLQSVPRDFSLVGADGQRRGYRFLLALARFILTDLRPVGLGSSSAFVDVDLQGVVHSVFERFVRNFLAYHLTAWRVHKTRRSWSDVIAHNQLAAALLPRFETDVQLSRPGHAVVIDTKFYSQTLRVHFGTEKVREAHLYQLVGYLHNLRLSGEFDGALIEGLLLYPLAQDDLDLKWTIHGFPVRLLTLDLSAPWPEVSARLLSLVDD